MLNPDARTTVGARPTLSANALGQLCADTLFAQGIAAAASVQRKEVDDALESIVEANTLLSGLGFESGGLAAAHSVAQGLTVISSVEKNYLHGEMVAMGLLTQLVLERREDEAVRVAEFFAAVGLPTHLGQLSLSADNVADLSSAMQAATTVPFLVNEPFPVSAEDLLVANRRADVLGKDVALAKGDAAWRALRP
jgi:glycerol dehydrogenase